MKTFKFYGVCNNRYKLDDTVWEAIEDPSDGYRSYLDSVVCTGESGPGDIFFPDALDTVYVSETQEKSFVGWEIKSTSDHHVWLRFGTDSYDDYYPCFIFQYEPRKAKPTWAEFIKGD